MAAAVNWPARARLCVWHAVVDTTHAAVHPEAEWMQGLQLVCFHVFKGGAAMWGVVGVCSQSCTVMCVCVFIATLINRLPVMCDE